MSYNRCFHEIFKKFEALKEVENLRTFIAYSVGDLKHLRYLNLSNTSIEWLPESISELYDLQALILCQCGSLKMLPKSIGNLIDL